MKMNFDPRALLRLAGLGLVILLSSWLLDLVRTGEVGIGTVLAAGLGLAGLTVAALLFRLPLYAFFGMHKAGERLVRGILSGMDEDADGRGLFLYQHSFFLYHLGRFRESLLALEMINTGSVPEAMLPVIDLNRGLLLQAMFRFKDSLDILEHHDEEEYGGRLRAFWQAYTANARAGLCLDLSRALALAEAAFGKHPSPKIAGVLGHVLWRMEHFDAARAWFGYATRRMPRRERHMRSQVWLWQAKMLLEEGDAEGSQKARARAQAIAPSDECRDFYDVFYGVKRKRPASRKKTEKKQ